LIDRLIYNYWYISFKSNSFMVALYVEYYTINSLYYSQKVIHLKKKTVNVGQVMGN